MVISELSAILPEWILTAGALFFLVMPIRKAPRLLGFLTLTFLLAALNLKLQWFLKQSSPEILFYGTYALDRFTGFFQLFVLLAMSLVVLATMGYRQEEVRGRREFYALLLLVTVALQFLIGSNHFALLYIALETVSVLSYLLVGFRKKDALAVEGGLKYFLFGSLATGAFLYGISLLYGLTGTLSLSGLATAFPIVMQNAPALGSVVLTLMLVGFAFKVALAPFHLWAPDAYEGAATPVTAFLSVAPKLAGFAILARVLLLGFGANTPFWTELLAVLAILTMTIGNVIALVQTSLKRLLAYSSIAHAGYIVIGLAVASPLGLAAAMYYLLAYMLMNIAAFIGVIAVENASGRDDLGAFSGLARTQPLLAFLVTVALLSLAGIPPMAGFFAKLWIFGAALQAGRIGLLLALVAAVNSVIAVFYYMKIVKMMYIDPARAGICAIWTPSLKIALIACIIAVFLVGLFPTPWMRFASYSMPLAIRPGDLPWLTLVVK